LDLALDLGRFNRTAAHDALTAGPSMGLGYAIDNGQAALEQPGADLAPQMVVGAEVLIYHDVGAASTGVFG